MAGSINQIILKLGSNYSLGQNSPARLTRKAGSNTYEPYLYADILIPQRRIIRDKGFHQLATLRIVNHHNLDTP